MTFIPRITPYDYIVHRHNWLHLMYVWSRSFDEPVNDNSQMHFVAEWRG